MVDHKGVSRPDGIVQDGVVVGVTSIVVQGFNLASVSAICKI